MRRLVVLGLVVVGALCVATPAPAMPGDADLDPGLADVTSMAVGADGGLWLTSADGVRRLDPDTLTVEDVVDVDIDGPFGIVAAADGDLWFLNGGTSTIGRLDPDTDEVTVTPAESLPTALFPGPAGSLWFLNESTGRYGPVAADGTLTSYRDRLDVISPQAGVAGPGGDVWFIATHGNGDGWLARVDPATGAATSVARPDGWWTTPQTIFEGPDGDVWMVGPAAQVAHLDPATETWTMVDDPMTPYLGAGVNWVTAVVADGEVWLADGRTVGRLDPGDGDLDVYPVTPPAEWSFDAQLVAEADGTPWLHTDQGLGPVELPSPGETDVVDPTIDLRSPVDQHAYLPNEEVAVDFDCADAASTVVTCEGLVPGWDPGAVDGEVLGNWPNREYGVFVYARDAAGNTDWVRHSHWVDALCHGQRADVFSIYRVGGYGRAGPGDDVGVGDNAIRGFGGDDLLCTGGVGAGNRGDDTVFGGSGGNRLDGGPGRDRLIGGAGPDQLDGGSGFDVCLGGRGHDTFTNCERVRQE